jgi:hypothetical protein
MSKALMNWWGEGFIKVAVVDGDRFNQDIFLGEVRGPDEFSADFK